jgi:hypothetical protein
VLQLYGLLGLRQRVLPQLLRLLPHRLPEQNHRLQQHSGVLAVPLRLQQLQQFGQLHLLLGHRPPGAQQPDQPMLAHDRLLRKPHAGGRLLPLRLQ